MPVFAATPESIQIAKISGAHSVPVATLASSVATDAFETRVLEYLRSICPADSCSATSVKFTTEATLVHRDPLLQAAWLQGRHGDLFLVQDTGHRTGECGDVQVFSACHRLVLCEILDDAMISISLRRERSQPAFAVHEKEKLIVAGGLLLSLAQRHCRLMSVQAVDPAESLASAEIIERRLRADRSGLAGRETQVLARVLRGMSTAAIAEDLGVRQDSVNTYRKRAYVKLDISSKWELMLRYFAMVHRENESAIRLMKVEPRWPRASESDTSARDQSVLVLPVSSGDQDSSRRAISSP